MWYCAEDPLSRLPLGLYPVLRKRRPREIFLLTDQLERVAARGPRKIRKNERLRLNVAVLSVE